ncbi:MAG: hypothetical protein ACQESP_11640 [Candidatus Muiribacteriota bacterium]
MSIEDTINITKENIPNDLYYNKQYYTEPENRISINYDKNAYTGKRNNISLYLSTQLEPFKDNEQIEILESDIIKLNQTIVKLNKIEEILSIYFQIVKYKNLTTLYEKYKGDFKSKQYLNEINIKQEKFNNNIEMLKKHLKNKLNITLQEKNKEFTISDNFPFSSHTDKKIMDFKKKLPTFEKIRENNFKINLAKKNIKMHNSQNEQEILDTIDLGLRIQENLNTEIVPILEINTDINDNINTSLEIGKEKFNISMKYNYSTRETYDKEKEQKTNLKEELNKEKNNLEIIFIQNKNRFNILYKTLENIENQKKTLENQHLSEDEKFHLLELKEEYMLNLYELLVTYNRLYVIIHQKIPKL